MSLTGQTAAQTEKTPDLTQYNILPQNTSQATQDILVPYFAGIQRIKTIWVSPALNVTTQEVKSRGGGGKGGGGGGSGQFKYFADMLALVAMGPADVLYQVIVDNTDAFSGAIFKNLGDEYVEVSIGQWGTMRLSWGEDFQNPPSAFNLHIGQGGVIDASGFTPPPMQPIGGQRGKVRVELRSFYFGAVGRTSAPTVELVIERIPLFPGYARGDPHIYRGLFGINPIVIIYEILTNQRYGLGLSQALFDIPYITLQINALSAYQMWLSPLIDSQQPIRSVIQNLCQYFDGFVRKVNGLIQIGFYAHSSVNGAGLPSLNLDNVLPPGVRLKPVGYTGTINEVMMNTFNSTNYFIPYSLRAADSASRLVTGQARNVTIDRPYIVHPWIAKPYVEEFLRFNSNPLVTGSCDVTKESVANMFVGDLVNIEAGDYGEQVLCRIKTKTWDKDNSGKCSIEFEQERGSFDSKYSPPKEYPDNNIYINPAQIKAALIVQLPYVIDAFDGQQIAVLAERASSTDMGFVTWISSDDSIFDSTGRASTFAIHGTMLSSLSNLVPQNTFDPEGFTVMLTGIDAGRVVSLTENQALSQTMLIFIDKEICSLERVTALGSHVFRITCIRGIYSSPSVGHDPGSSVWFIERNLLVPIAWGALALGSTFYFKLQVYTQFATFDLSTSTSLAFTIGKVNASLPGPTNLTVGTDGSRVIFNWKLDPSTLVFGYEIRYGTLGSTWAQATKAIEGIRSAHTVSMIIPPGAWTFYVTSYDQFFNYSPNIASYDFTVPTLYTLIENNYGQPQHTIDVGGLIDYDYGLPGSTLTNCFIHPTAYVLVPIDGSLASAGTAGDNFFDIFDNFVLTPPATCTFTSAVLDSKGSGTSVRSSIAVYEYLWGFSGIEPTGRDYLIPVSPQWGASGTSIVNGYIHPTAYCVVPTSSHLANFVPSGGTGFEMFDTFVLNPVTPTTVTYIQDIGSNGPLLSSLTTSFGNGPDGSIPTSSASISYSDDGITYKPLVSGVGTVSGTTLTRFIKYTATINDPVNAGVINRFIADTLVAPPSYWTSINGQMRTSMDGIIFGAWQSVQSNFVSDQYIQFMVSWDPYSGVWPAGVSSIWTLLDAPSSIQQAVGKPIAVGGTVITFDPPFRQILPPVQITIVGNSALFPIVIAQSLISFTVKVFNTAGVDVGGSINWSAEGV